MRLLRNLITVAVGLALIGAIGLVAIGPHRLYIVRTGSMSPTVPPGSVVLVDLHRVPRVGQIITFQYQGKVITHRLVKVAHDGTLQTKGDANRTVDPWRLTDANVVGTVTAHVPVVGWGITYLRQPTGAASVVIFVLLIWLWREAPEADGLEKGRLASS